MKNISKLRKAFMLLMSMVIMATMFSGLCLTASAVTTTAFSNISSSKPMKCYTISTSSKQYICYTAKDLKTKGTDGKKSSTAYIANTDELYVLSVGKNSSGTYYAYVSYPVGKTRYKAYIKLSEVTANNSNHEARICTSKTYTSLRAGKSKGSTYAAKGDTVYLIATSGSNYQIMYPLSGGGYRLAWITKTEWNNNFSSSNNKLFTYSYNNTGKYVSSTSSSYKITVNGKTSATLTPGTTFYTYNDSNGSKKTTSGGYYYVKVGSKYVYTGGAQCLAYARYIQQLLYGYNDGNNSGKFNTKTVNATVSSSTAKSYITSAGVGAHIRSYYSGGGEHSLVVIGIDSTGFYFTDANYDGKNTIRIGHFTWDGFASSNYKKIKNIKTYKG